MCTRNLIAIRSLWTYWSCLRYFFTCTKVHFMTRTCLASYIAVYISHPDWGLNSIHNPMCDTSALICKLCDIARRDEPHLVKRTCLYRDRIRQIKASNSDKESGDAVGGEVTRHWIALDDWFLQNEQKNTNGSGSLGLRTGLGMAA